MKQLTISTSFSRSGLVKFLLETLFWINLFFALFPAWRLSPLWNYIPVDGYFNTWMALLDKINILICIIILLFDHRIKEPGLFYAIILLFVATAISMFANQMPTGIVTLVCFPIEYLVICLIARNYTFSSSIIKITFIVFAFWSIAPLLVMFSGSMEQRIAMISDVHGKLSTFGGFAFHRNFYGFYTGITILLCLFRPIKRWLSFSIIILCLIGILISASRSALMCTVLAVLLYFFLTNKKKFMAMLPIMIALSAIVISAYAYFNIRSKGLEDNDDRMELLGGFAKIIQESPIWGQGQASLYQSPHYPLGSPAHNFIVQVWADYGLITLLFLLGLLALLYKKSNVYLKVLICYLLLFGLTQPYFYLSMPQAFMMIVFLLGNCIEFKPRLKPLPT